MAISFSGVTEEQYPFVVLDTDYESYSIVYECGISLGFQRTERLWVLTREGLVRGAKSFEEMKEKTLGIIDRIFMITS